MAKSILLVIFLLASGQCSFAQAQLPVIKAGSRLVSIRDGLHFTKAYWNILPGKKPDYYYVEIPGKEHRVTFITDQDSISFDVKYGGQYDFIILLNNKDSCYTRISATYKETVSYKSNASPAAPDTIPFTIGNNSKIYFKAHLNNSEPLDVQFDLGAGGCGIKKSSVKKVRMNFDDSLILHNSDGSNLVPSSSSNTLEIAGVRWDSILFAVADNYTYREDLLVGNSLFQNKVLEINYDKKVVIVHDSMPVIAPGYSKHEMILAGGIIPFIQGSCTIGSAVKTGWFMFDTGAYTTILTTNKTSAAGKLFIEWKKMFGLKTKTTAPGLTIGNYAFTDFNYTVQKAGNDDTQLGLLGNDLLKRFNVIIDNRNGFIYLKPNSLVNETYANPEYYLVRVITAVLILMIALVIFIVYRKRRKKKQSMLSRSEGAPEQQ